MQNSAWGEETLLGRRVVELQRRDLAEGLTENEECELQRLEGLLMVGPAPAAPRRSLLGLFFLRRTSA